MSVPVPETDQRGTRAVACQAARQVLAELEARGGFPEKDLEELKRHYRRLEGRLDR